MTIMTAYATTYIQPSIDQLGYDLERRWYHGRQIVVYAPLYPNNIAIDIWRKAVREDVHRWPRRQKHLVVHDLSHLPWTPQLNDTLKSVAHYYPQEATGRYAVILNASFMNMLMSMFRRGRLDQWLPGFESHFYYRYDLAMEWVCELV